MESTGVESKSVPLLICVPSYLGLEQSKTSFFLMFSNQQDMLLINTSRCVTLHFHSTEKGHISVKLILAWMLARMLAVAMLLVLSAVIAQHRENAVYA